MRATAAIRAPARSEQRFWPVGWEPKASPFSAVLP